MTRSINIAVLVCGKLTGKAYAAAGDYPDVYYKFIHDAKPHDVLLAVDNYHVVTDTAVYPNEDKYDAIIITGSPASAYENLDWINKLVDFITSVAHNKPHIKLIGICFGHQVIARALGGECVPNGGRWEVGPTPIQLTSLGKHLFGDSDTINLQQMHRDHVPSVPPNFHLLASSPISPNQGMVRFAPASKSTPDADSDSSKSPFPAPPTNVTDPLPPIQIFTVQGHPEFTEPIVTAIIEQRAASGVIDAPAAQNAELRRFWRNDGVSVVGKALWEKVILG